MGHRNLLYRNGLLACMLTMLGSLQAETDYYAPQPFGTADKWALNSDNVATGKWWEKKLGPRESEFLKWFLERQPEQALAFALYTHDHGVLKISGQCFPLYPEEPKTVVLELKQAGEWTAVSEEPIVYPGWSVHFRIENWDNTKDVPYRLRLGDQSSFEGLIRKDPVDQDSISVANMSCNSFKDKEVYTRQKLVENLIQQDPDLLFFAGDQNYHHDEATYGWLQFGIHFRDVMRDRPTISIPDDHDVGHANLWGESGKKSEDIDGATDGGYMYPASYVRMVERQQTWNLPDAFDPTPIEQGIGVYYTDLTVGGVNFAILEDRKFKSAPLGNLPKMGHRRDHIKDPDYDRAAVDKPGLALLGERQLAFLDAWVMDWEGAELKVALSQTAFAGAVHLHGSSANRLLADLDCNGWPQSGRNRALERLRKARATHLCGDQHLAVVIKHGIEGHRDGPMSFTSPALVNTIYGRWWWPLSEEAGGGVPVASPLPWVGDYEDGFGNLMTMIAYANPTVLSVPELRDGKSRGIRGDGYGLARFNTKSGEVVFECWPRFADLSLGDAAQFEGWPVRFNNRINDGRKPVGYLQEVSLPVENAVVSLTDDKSGEVIYCYRVMGSSFKAPVYAAGDYTLKAGTDTADTTLLTGQGIYELAIKP